MSDKIQADFYAVWKGTLIKLSISEDTVLDKISEYITVDASSNTVQVTLPDTSSLIENGKKIWIIDSGSAATNNITVIPNPSDSTTIHGLSELIISENNDRMELELIESVWFVLNHIFDTDRVLIDNNGDVIADNNGNLVLDGSSIF